MSNIEQVREIAHDVIGREVTEGKMPKVHVYDNGGKTLDRYTIVPQGKGWEYDRAGTQVHMLGVGSDPRGYSQWTGGVEGKHLGKKIKFSNLPKNVQQHVKMRLTEDVNDLEEDKMRDLKLLFPSNEVRITLDKLYPWGPGNDVPKHLLPRLKKVYERWLKYAKVINERSEKDVSLSKAASFVNKVTVSFKKLLKSMNRNDWDKLNLHLHKAEWVFYR